MNLKDFSLLKEDNDSYHVKHPKGKTLVVSKKGMADKAHEIIKGLKKPDMMADGGEMSVNISDEPFDASKLKLPRIGDDLKQDVPQSDLDKAKESATALTNVTGNMIPEYAAATTPASAPTQTPVNLTPATPSEVSMPDMTQFKNANQMGQAAGRDVYKSAQQQENAAAGMIPGLQEQQQQVQSDADMVQQNFQQHYVQEAAKADELQKKYDSMQIDPHRIINNMSTGTKISTALGLLLGGLSSGFTGKNPALDVLNNAIDRDIDAQKNNKAGVMNLWRMNMEQSGNQLEANLRTKQQVLGAAQAVLSANAAKTGAAQTKVAAASAMQQLSQQQMQIQQQLAAMKLGQGTATPQNMPAILRAKAQAGLISPAEHEAAMKELSTSQEAGQIRGDLLQSFQDLNSQFLAGALHPGDTKSAKDFLAGRMGKLMEGRYNEEAAKKQIEAIMPAAFDSDRTRQNKLSRLNQLLDTIQYNNPHLQSLGLGTLPPKRKINGR